jgi:hypothetical protein
MPQGYCTSCDYSLEGVTRATCPECGRAFDPARPQTYAARPGTRRRRMIQRIAWLFVIIAAAMILSPRRIERLEFSWPNPDRTATSQTRWELVAPSFLPFRYPHWTTSPRPAPFGPNGLTVYQHKTWALRCLYPISQGSSSGMVPKAAPGMRAIGVINSTDIQPQNFDELTDLLVYGIGTGGRIIVSSRIVLDHPPPAK